MWSGGRDDRDRSPQNAPTMTRRLTHAALTALTLVALAGCGDGEPIEPLTTTGAAPQGEQPADPQADAGEGGGGAAGGGSEPVPGDKPGGPAEGPSGDPRETALEREAERAVGSFVAALDARDGERACALLAPDALQRIELPERRRECAASLAASIGYRDARGLPVWGGAEVSQVRSVEIDGATAKVVATVVTRFADRDEVSIEDDVVYLQRSGDGWVVAQPSSTLYRAVGIADIPPSVLSPPAP
jgi:hypothetical protein